jgi:glycosyltransferase involved in cell wall biosynthesis
MTLAGEYSAAMTVPVSRRRLLFISPCTPDPQGTGWEQRAFSFLSAYSKFTDVELWFLPTQDNPELLRIEKSAQLCSSITAFHLQFIDDVTSHLRSRLIRSLSTADVVHVFRLPKMVASINHKRIVWDIDELPWLALGQPTADRQRLSDFYTDCFRRCRKVFASSNHERQQARFARIEVVPNVAIDPQIREIDRSEGTTTLLFVGNLNYVPNLDALAFFNDSVLPHLTAGIQNVNVDVVGRSPVSDVAAATINRLRDTGRFRFVLDAPTCTPHYAQAAASIVPILAGGGTRIKILESFAHHCPVVSTTKGCEGLDVVHREHLLIEDIPNNFAQACAELINNPNSRAKMTRAAYTFFDDNHSQKVVDQMLYAALEKL